MYLFLLSLFKNLNEGNDILILISTFIYLIIYN